MLVSLRRKAERRVIPSSYVGETNGESTENQNEQFHLLSEEADQTNNARVSKEKKENKASPVKTKGAQ